MVVVPEPAVKGGGALVARAVDRPVRPAGEQGADEALGLAVGLWPVGARAAVADPQRSAGERVDRRPVAGAVVGQDPLDLDAAPAGVGEGAVVVDGDVDVLPADGLAADPGRVRGGRCVVAETSVDAFAGAAFDPAELLDVEVHELA